MNRGCGTDGAARLRSGRWRGRRRCAYPSTPWCRRGIGAARPRAPRRRTVPQSRALPSLDRGGQLRIGRFSLSRLAAGLVMINVTSAGHRRYQGRAASKLVCLKSPRWSRSRMGSSDRVIPGTILQKVPEDVREVLVAVRRVVLRAPARRVTNRGPPVPESRA